MNINDDVWVRLTPDGEKRLEEVWRGFARMESLRRNQFKNGWWKFQMWDLMHTFGPMIFMGCGALPFEKNEIRLSDPHA